MHMSSKPSAIHSNFDLKRHCMQCVGAQQHIQVRTPIRFESPPPLPPAINCGYPHTSIHTASTGPSNTIHLLSGVFVLAYCRMRSATMPSHHSCVFLSNSPYSWPDVMDLGFTTTDDVFWILGPVRPAVYIGAPKEVRARTRNQGRE